VGAGLGALGFGTGAVGAGLGALGFGTGTVGAGLGAVGFGSGAAGAGMGAVGFGTGAVGAGIGTAGFGTGIRCAEEEVHTIRKKEKMIRSFGALILNEFRPYSKWRGSMVEAADLRGVEPRPYF
jgi:hypothetical protein